MEYIGIDISKKTFDVATAKKSFKFDNNPKGFKKFLSLCKSFDDVYCLCEATGGCEIELALFLCEHKLKITIANPKNTKNFFRCIGANAKTDKLDAMVLREYCLKFNDKLLLWESPSLELLKFRKYFKRREALVNMLTQEKNRLSKETDKDLQKLINAIIKKMQDQIKLISSEISKLLKTDEKLKTMYNMIISIDGCGDIAGQAILSELPEIGTLEKNKLAALVGVAPMNRDSGIMKGKRAIQKGRQLLKHKLYLPTMAAMHHNEYIKTFADRLLSKGKSFKQALIACMRKLIIYINAQAKKILENNPIFA